MRTYRRNRRRSSHGLVPVASIVFVAAAISAAVLFDQNQVRPIGAEALTPTSVPRSLTPEPTPSVSDPAPSAEPTLAPSTPTRAETLLLVGPGSICADGEAGFSVFLPDGWYANRRFGDSPPCRTLGTAHGVLANAAESGARLAVVTEAPTFEAIESHAQIDLPGGVTVDRYVLTTPEQGAVAAERTVTYVARLPSPDGVSAHSLLASTDANDAQSVAQLERVMNRLELFQPIPLDPTTVAAAAVLFENRDHCTIPGRDITVVHPDAWWTNTPVGAIDPCTFYAPTSFELDGSGAVPGAALVRLSVHDSEVGVTSDTAVTWWDSTVIGNRPATRWMLEPQGSPGPPVYQVIIQLGEAPEAGPNLVATTLAADADEYAMARAVLDELMVRIALVPSPPGATSAGEDFPDSPLSASDASGDFVLEMTVEARRVRAGQPIFVNARLRHGAATETVTVRGSGYGWTRLGVVQLDGAIDPGGGETSDCTVHEIPATGLRVTGKSAAFDGSDPLAPFYEAYGSDPLLRLPAGTYEISATAHFFTDQDCVADSEVVLRASVTVLVEP